MRPVSHLFVENLILNNFWRLNSYRKRVSRLETLPRIRATYGNHVMSRPTTYGWYYSFVKGRESAKLTGGPATPSWKLAKVAANTCTSLLVGIIWAFDTQVTSLKVLSQVKPHERRKMGLTSHKIQKVVNITEGRKRKLGEGGWRVGWVVFSHSYYIYIYIYNSLAPS